MNNRAPFRGWQWIASLLIAAGTAVSAQSPGLDWPQYFGPERNGTADFTIDDRAALIEVWRRPFAYGTAGVTVANGRLFTLGSDGTDDYLFALDAASGKDLWRTGLGTTHADATNGPASTPVAVNDLVIAIGSSCRITAVRASDGGSVWQRSLGDDYKSRFAARGGCGMSPIVSGTSVIVSTGAQEGTRLVALDSTSGKEVWAAKDVPMSLNGAQGIANFDGVRQVLYHHAKPPGVSGVSGVRR
jgi:outer membrane protein assembly factor BamB